MSYISRKIQKLIHAYVYKNTISLEDGGERVDVIYQQKIDINKLNVYEKSHYFRYIFAKKIITKSSVCGDFACGSGYGSIMLSEIAKKVIGVDNSLLVIDTIKKRYASNSRVAFIHDDLLNLQYDKYFDYIISFETIEHFSEINIQKLFHIYYRSLKPKGKIIFSTPYKQKNSIAAKKLGFHKTFHIDKTKICAWLKNANFSLVDVKWQSYQTHEVQDNCTNNDFIICTAQKYA